MRGAAHPQAMLTHSVEDNQKVLSDTIKAVGDLSKVQVFHNRILVATFKRPEKTASGLYLSDKTRDEDDYQGAVSMVLKVGPGAFVDSGSVEFFGLDVKPGDLVVHSLHSGRRMAFNGVHCRIIEDAHVDMVIPRPDMVF